jgi:Protein phosphatase 2C
MGWRWIAAKRRGSSHVRVGSRIQDAFVASTIPRYPDVLSVIVSDGAGSASRGGEGASLVCRTLATEIRTSVALTGCLPTKADVSQWIEKARDRITAVAYRRELRPRDFAATMIVAISDSRSTRVAHIGDGSVVVKTKASQQWVATSWPDGGEFASTTFFITDGDSPKVTFVELDDEIDALVAFSDGMERLALDMQAKVAHAPFFDSVSRPLAASSTQGLNRTLSLQLNDFLGGPAVLSRTDDDKTLIVASFS